MDLFFCNCIWTESSGGCEIFHDYIYDYHVVLSCGTLYILGQSLPFWTNGCMDWYVRRLDNPLCHFREQIPKWQMVKEAYYLVVYVVLD